MRRKRVWIVEVKYYDPGVIWSQTAWHPTVSCALTQEDGKRVLRDWRKRNPDDRFRLICYLATMRRRGGDE